MDSKDIDFALSFMLEHPQAAVKVLEQSDVAKVAAFFEQVPENYLIPVLRQMLPEYAGKVALNLSAPKAAALMEDMDINNVAHVLRLMAKENRRDILDELPKKKRQGVELLLTFAPRTIGAWMTPHCLSLPGDASVADAVDYFKSGTSANGNSEYIYLVNRDGHLLGKAAVMTVLKSGQGLPLSSIMEQHCPSLPAAMLLEQALEHKAWQHADSLPVTSREQQFLGTISHNAMRNGLSQLHSGMTANSDFRDPVSSLFEAYGKSLLALFNTVSEAVDQD